MPASTIHDRAPPSPAASDGESSSESSAPPSTPPLATSLPMPTFMNFTSQDTVDGVPSLAGAKRSAKNVRRVNTAERRATHNAVERARRETLNGRFLDLATLLPNLNTIRRPSKASIVNSSIAHLNASRRHRLMAAQQLRLVKDEADSLRQEINQWRARAGVQGLEEPMRADAFSVVLSGELEFEASDLLDASEEGEDEEGSYGVLAGYSTAQEPPQEEYARAQAEMVAAQQAEAELGRQQAHAAAGYPPEPTSPHGYYHSSPTVVAPTFAAAYENPAAAYRDHYDAASYEQPHIQGTPVHPSVDMEHRWAVAAAHEKQRRMSMHYEHSPQQQW